MTEAQKALLKLLAMLLERHVEDLEIWLPLVQAVGNEVGIINLNIELV